MMQSAHPGDQAAPRTLVGMWLVAMLLDDEDLQRRLTRRIAQGGQRLADDEAAVLQEAGALAIGQYFRSAGDSEQLEEFIAILEDVPSIKGLPEGDVERVVRAALSGPGIEEADYKGRSRILGTAIYLVVKRLEMTRLEINRLVAEAEAAQPPLPQPRPATPFNK